MPTWQILSGDGNSLQWEISDQDVEIQDQDEPGNGASFHIQGHSSSSRLPSMADLLLQGNFLIRTFYFRIFVCLDCNGNVFSYRMFEASGES